jgi:hypothetical protein
MDIQTILPYLISAITGIAGWLGGRRKKAADDKKVEAEAKTIELSNDERMMQMQQKYIVEPVLEKVSTLSKEIRRLRLAINKISDCPYEASCPVRHELQKMEDEV